MLLWADHVAALQFIEGATVMSWPRHFYTLARCALEAGSQAAWVMEPVESEDRVRTAPTAACLRPGRVGNRVEADGQGSGS